MRILPLFSLITILILTTGCASFKEANPESKTHSESITKEPLSERSSNVETYQAHGKTYYVKESPNAFKQRGQASWYGHAFHGRRTASGETFNMHNMTAAHQSLSLPAHVRVTNLQNGKSIIVRVNDRMPRHKTRVIDVSYGAAKQLGMHRAGLANVEIERVHLVEAEK